MLISYYAHKKSSPRLPSWQPSLISFNTPIESGSIIKPCTLKHFQVPILAPGLYWYVYPKWIGYFSFPACSATSKNSYFTIMLKLLIIFLFWKLRMYIESTLRLQCEHGPSHYPRTTPPRLEQLKALFIDNSLVRVHIIWWLIWVIV